MRFLHSFPLPLLLILISLVSLDFQAIPHGFNKTHEKSPNSQLRLSRSANETSFVLVDSQATSSGENETKDDLPVYKRRIDRSVDDESISADEENENSDKGSIPDDNSSTDQPENLSTDLPENLSTDQLEKLLKRLEPAVEKEKKKIDVKRSELRKKENETVAAKEDYDRKKNKFDLLNKGREDAEETLRKAELAFEPALERFDNAEEALQDAKNKLNNLQTAKARLVEAQIEEGSNNTARKGLETAMRELKKARREKAGSVSKLNSRVKAVKDKIERLECVKADCVNEKASAAKLDGELKTANNDLLAIQSNETATNGTLIACKQYLSNLQTEIIQLKGLTRNSEDDLQKNVDAAQLEYNSADEDYKNKKDAKEKAEGAITDDAVVSDAGADVDVAVITRDKSIEDETKLRAELTELEKKFAVEYERVGALKQEYQKRLMDSNPGLGTLSIVGICAAFLILACGAIAGILFFVIRRRRRAKQPAATTPGSTPVPTAKTPAPIENTTPSLKKETPISASSTTDSTVSTVGGKKEPAQQGKQKRQAKVEKKVEARTHAELENEKTALVKNTKRDGATVQKISEQGGENLAYLHKNGGEATIYPHGDMIIRMPGNLFKFEGPVTLRIRPPVHLLLNARTDVASSISEIERQKALIPKFDTNMLFAYEVGRGVNKYKDSPEMEMGHGASDNLRQEVINILKKLIGNTQNLREVENLSVEDVRFVLDNVKELFAKDMTLVEIAAPSKIFGDIHGDFPDFVRMMEQIDFIDLLTNPSEQTKLVFLGDYVDRGDQSLEVFMLLSCLKILFPDRVVMLRGNHETRLINKAYGFYEELTSIYNNEDVKDGENLWEEFNAVFDWMPLACLIGGSILCMHGGISRTLKTLDQIRHIIKPCSLNKVPNVEDKNDPAAMGLIWADPANKLKGYTGNKKRGNISDNFGPNALREFMTRNQVKLIIRAHQVPRGGFAIFGDFDLLSVFSALDYDRKKPNLASITTVSKDMDVGVTVFRKIRKGREGGKDAFVKEMDTVFNKQMVFDTVDDDGAVVDEAEDDGDRTIILTDEEMERRKGLKGGRKKPREE